MALPAISYLANQMPTLLLPNNDKLQLSPGPSVKLGKRCLLYSFIKTTKYQLVKV